MDCAQLAPMFEEYALGALEGEERAELQTHLARGCVPCTAGVARARWVVAQLAHCAPVAEPPASLRAKILSAANAERTAAAPLDARAAQTGIPVWAWIAAATLALVTGYSVRQMRRETTQITELRREMKLAEAQNRWLQDRLEIDRQIATVMMSPDSVPLKLMPKDTAMPMVHAYLDTHMGVALTADQMPQMTAARTLQLWLVPKTGKPVSAAIFRPDSQGQVAIVAPVHMATEEIAALAVSEEPAGGSPQPTTTPAWVAPIPHSSRN